MSAQSGVVTDLKFLGTLGVPIILTQLSQMGIGVIDAIMAGRVSPTDLAGVALGGNFYFPPVVLLSGVAMAVTPLVSQMHGAGKEAGGGAVVRQALWIGVLGGLLAMGLMLQFGEAGYRLIGVDEAAIPIATAYLTYMSFGVVPTLAFFVLRYLCEGLSWTTPSMIVAFGGLLLKLPLNYLFVYGGFGIPAMGGAGCGVSTAIVMWLQLGAMIFIVRYSRVQRAGAFSRFSLPDFTVIWRLVKLGLPIGVTMFFEGTVFSIVTLLIGRISVEAVAAHQIVFNVGSVTSMIPVALGVAATIRAGYNVGAKDYPGARRSVYVALGAAVTFAFLAASALLLLRDTIAAVYTTDTSVIASASALLVILALYQFVDDTQTTAIGCLRGYKDVRVPMIMVLIAHWGIGIPVGSVLGYGLFGLEPWGVSGFWWGLIIGFGVSTTILNTRLAIISRSERRIERYAAA